MNAISLPLDTIFFEGPSDAIPDKDAVYFIYCHSGNRSEIASAQLLSMGYKNIYDLGAIVDCHMKKKAAMSELI